MKKALFLISLFSLMLVGNIAKAQTYTMVTSASELQAGAKFIIVGMTDDGSAYAMGYQKSNNRFGLQVSYAGGVVTATVATDASNQTDAYELELGSSNGNWTFYDALNEGYLYAGSSESNHLKTKSTLDANGEWSVNISSDGAAVVVAQGSNTRNIMRFNDNDMTNVLFSCYMESSSVIKPVYFFVAGEATTDPEPSSYPADFTASVSQLDVTLNWSDATGEQLPRAYLILGSTSNITAPADGTQVANDLDATDGTVAYNVNYGVESYTFTGLQGGKTYNFAIFPYSNSSTNIDYKNDGSYPTASATTANICNLLNADFAESLSPFTAFDVYGDQTWDISTYGGVSFAKMSGYANGGNNENEDWLISPNLFANGGYEHVYLSFSNAYKYDGEPLRVMVSTDYDGASEPSDYSWTDITSHFTWSEGNYVWTESGAQDLSQYVSLNAKLYVAFVYNSTTAASSTWELTNVVALGEGYTSVNDNVAAREVVLYPNPASDRLFVSADNNSMVEVIDLSGRVMIQQEMIAGENAVDLSQLEKGTYILRMKTSDGMTAVSKFVKE